MATSGYTTTPLAAPIDATQTRYQPWAAVLLACTWSIALSGCQSPWRLWRSGEPSMEQLLVHPEPWDAEARLASASGRRTTPRNTSVARAGQESESESDQATGTDDRNGDFYKADLLSSMNDDDFKRAYEATPPSLRPLLKQQYEAVRAMQTKNPDGDRPAESQAAEPKSSRAENSLAQSTKNQSPKNQSSKNDSRGSTLRLSDDDEQVTHARDRELLDPTDAEGELDRESQLGRYSADKRPDTRPEARSTQTSSWNELEPPPPGKQSSRQLAHVKAVDTGVPEHDLLLQATARNQKSKNEQLKNEPSSQSTLDEAVDNSVTTASAESHIERTGDRNQLLAARTTLETEANAEKSWQDMVRDALRKKVQQRDNTDLASPAQKLHDQATERMLALAIGDQEAALKPIEGLQSHEQEFFEYEFQALFDATNIAGNPVLARRWTLVSDSHRKAQDHLSAVSNLEIKNAMFCSDVSSYGVVKKYANTHFRANQEVLLYCELNNFVADPVKDGFETQLQGSYEIVDASGRRVADLLLPPDSDFCRHQRRDYFIAYSLYMPEKIENGRYQLRLTIEDMKGRKFGQATLDFQIAP